MPRQFTLNYEHLNLLWSRLVIGVVELEQEVNGFAALCSLESAFCFRFSLLEAYSSL